MKLRANESFEAAKCLVLRALFLVHGADLTVHYAQKEVADNFAKRPQVKLCLTEAKDISARLFWPRVAGQLTKRRVSWSALCYWARKTLAVC